MLNSIDTRKDLGEDEFVRNYLNRRRPVIVEGAMDSWPARTRWTTDFLDRQFGELVVLVQGNTFRPLDVMKLGMFLKQMAAFEEMDCFGRSDVPYVRYTHLNGVDTDDLAARVLQELSGDWSIPVFLPRTLYVIPCVERDADPTSRRFPSFGLYISPRGACTSLHLDADLTSAVSCQFKGTKRWFIFEPGLRDRLPRYPLPPTNILKHPIPDFGGVEPTYVFTIGPGQILYLPGDWYHEVYTMEASITLTFNFVHLSETQGWVEAVLEGLRRAVERQRPGPVPSIITTRLHDLLASLQCILNASERPQYQSDLERWAFSDAQKRKIFEAVRTCLGQHLIVESGLSKRTLSTI